MRRGELWWVNFPPPIGRRPAVLLSRDRAYEIRTRVTVAPITTRARSIRSHVELGSEDGLKKTSAANLDDITTIPKDLLQERISRLNRQKIQAVDRAIKYALALGSSSDL